MSDQAENMSDTRKSMLRGKETSRLRLLFLIPLGLTIVVIVAVLILMLFQHEDQSIDDDTLKIRSSAKELYESSIHHDARALRTVMNVLKSNQELHKALKQADRLRLLKDTAPLFATLKRDYSITHFYFSGIDRVNLLRVHAPQRFGDRINRITTLQAEKSGSTEYGVELGPLGTFTLRLVTPWYDQQSKQLIGYVELGMEIDRVLQKLRDFFGVEVYVFINKNALEREKWKQGMQLLKRTPDWEQFPSVVIASQSPEVLPAVVIEHIKHSQLSDSNTIFETMHKDVSYQLAFLPLMDAAKHTVAHMILLTNISEQLHKAHRNIYIGGVTALFVGFSLFGFFYWQVGRIGQRIECDALELEKLASHDGLTGLYNHRSFYIILDEEISRSLRHNKSFAILMLDIDHFKRVNDTYGHQAGDLILRGMSDRLVEEVRNIDHVCRYGGEEITIILPETGIDDMMIMAERLRAAVADRPFDIGTDQFITITISIGVASFPHDSDNAVKLFDAADTAMYKAKESGRNKVCTMSDCF